MITHRPSTRSIVLILGSLTAFGPLSIDMYLAAFPTIATHFNVSIEHIQLSLTSFFIGLTLGQVLYGPIIDRYGRKKPVIGGLLLYAIASFFCAFAFSADALIAARFVQALGACAGMVAARTIVRDLFNENETARIFSLLMLVMGLAPILAPMIGGYILLVSNWKTIFYLIGTLSVVALLMVVKFLPETRGPDSTVKFSNALSLYRNILRDKKFVSYSLAGGFAQAGMFAYITGSPFVFINLFGIPAENYGYIFGMNAFGLIASSQLNARLLKRMAPASVLRMAFPILALTGGLLLIISRTEWGLFGLMIPLFFFIATLGITLPNTSALALSNAANYGGSASALLGTIQFSCAVTSSAVVGQLSDGTAFGMSFTIALCGLIGFLIFWLNQNRELA